MKRTTIARVEWNPLTDDHVLLFACGHNHAVPGQTLYGYGFDSANDAVGSHWNCPLCVEEPMDAAEAFRIASVGVNA